MLTYSSCLSHWLISYSHCQLLVECAVQCMLFHFHTVTVIHLSHFQKLSPMSSSCHRYMQGLATTAMSEELRS